MNKIYKVIWSKVRNCYVAVSEIAKRNGKSCTSVNCGAKADHGHSGVALSAAVGATLLAGVCSVLLPVRVALAAPELLTLPTLDVNGKSAAVTIASTSSATSATMNINSTQTNNVLKWIDFSVGKGGAVNFTDSHNYLNYVTGHGRSEIDGTLTGAGNIYLINPNGILFGSNASVDVGNLYLSTRSLTDAQLNDFANNGTNPLGTTASSAAGDIINLGRLNANNITVEGNNISFKNVADVGPKDNAKVNVNLRAGGEVHVGYAPYDQKATSVNPTQYTDGDTTKKTIDYSKWNSFSVENNVKRLDGSAFGTYKYTEYMLVRNASELQNMQNNLTGNYMLANDIDFNDDSNFTNGFKPIGYKDNTGVRHSYSGKFDGLNFVIKNLKITDNSISSSDSSLDVKEHVGLFGDNIGTIENVGVVDTDINVNKKVVGGIVGYNNGGTVRNVYHTGSVKADNEQVGGIAGANTGVIEKAYNTGSVDGAGNIGGIVGHNNDGKIREAYNASNVGGNSTSPYNSGGIVGYTMGTSSGVYNTYNEGSITGGSRVGGIVGRIDNYTEIKSSYNTGAITQGGVDGGGGGIVGYAQQSTYVYFSTPAFFREGTGTNTYGGSSKTVTELKQSGTFSGWNSDPSSLTISATGGDKTTWRISNGQTTPQLTAFLKTKDYINKRPYDGTADFGEYKNVGTYKNEKNENSKTIPVTTHQVEGLEQGFDYVQDVSVIEPKELLLVADKISIKKDGTVPSNFTGRITGFAPGESLGAGDTLKFALTEGETPTAVGFYGVKGTLKIGESNPAESGTYGTNYTFTNDPANASAFSIVVGVMPKLDFKGASPYVTIASTPDTMNISSLQTNNVLKWMDFSIDKDGKVIFDTNNYLNYVTGHGRSEIDGTLSGGGNIYLINPNGMVFGSNASVNVGNLYLSTRSIDDTTLKSFDNNNAEAMSPLSTPAASATGDIVNLGTLTAANITAEGNNISFKNVEDVSVTGTDKINVRASGEVHVGYANTSTATTEINYTDYYATVNEPNLTSKWNFTGLDQTTAVSPVMYMLVRNASELQNMQSNLTGNYMLANDIDASGIEHFQPIGSDSTSGSPTAGMFQGRLDGLNYEIQNIKIDSNDNAAGNKYSNIGIIGSNAGIIENLHVTNGTVNVNTINSTNTDSVGGIVGANKAGAIIRNVSFSGSVTGRRDVGGIAGFQNGTPTAGTIEKAYNQGTIQALSTASDNAGGIVGYNGGYVREVYNSGKVSGEGNSIGGIVGLNSSSGKVEYAYNTGDITGIKQIGGIVGRHDGGQNSIKFTYNTGVLTGSSYIGDILGNGAKASYSYFSNGYYDANGDIQTATQDLKAKSTFSLWGNDISAAGGAGKVWRIYEGQTTPLLTAFLKTKDVITETEYNGTAQSFDENLVTGDIHIYATNGGVYASETNAGKHEGLTGDKVLYSDQLGYDLVDTKLIIQPKRVTATFGSNTYNGTAVFTGVSGTLSDVIPEDATYVTVTSTATYNDKNVGSGKSVSYSDIALDGTKKDNYIIVDGLTGTGTITPAPVTISVNDYTRTYDGTTDASGATLVITNGTSDALFGTDTASGGTKTFDTKNVVEGKNKITVSDVTITDGNEGKNYAITYAQNTNSKITTKALSVGNVTKEYDGNATASLTVSNLLGVEECDKTGLSISAGVVANYTNNTGDKDANAGTGKRVEYTGLTLSGAEAGNYTIDPSGTSTTGNSITARPLTMGSVSKVYDGTDNALVSVYALTNAIEDDLLDLSFKGTSSGKYNSGKNVGDNLTVTYTGLILEGAKAGNYTIDSDAVVTGNSITPKELTLVADKVTIKSGETVPPFTGNIIGFVEGERLASEDDLKFALAGTEPTMAGSYAIVGKLKDSASGNYQENGVYKAKDNTFANYTFSNAPANEKAFTIAVDVMPQLDYRGASADVTIDTATTANTMAISSIKSNNVLKWIDFSIGSGGTVQFDAKNYLNYVTGHGRSEIYGTLTGGGDIYLINPNGMLFGSTAQVNVGNLYLSTRSFDVDDELDDKLNDYLNNRTIPTGSTILGDVTNLGKLNTNGVVNPNTNVLTNTIEVEGKNISIKNIADVTTGGTLTNGTLSGGSMHDNVKLTSHGGEIHLGFAVGVDGFINGSAAVDLEHSRNQYTNVNAPTLTGWTANVTPVKYMLVHNAYELQNINNNLTGNYMLANDINFTKENGDWIIRNFKSLGSKGNNWGSRPGMFQGRLDGLNHVIRNINITNTNNESYSTDVGIIGSNAGIVENFGVVNGNIVLSSKSWVGGIVGANKGCGIIRNVYFSGLVEGSSNVGGIAGAQDGSNTQPGVPLPGGIIEKAYASGTVRSNNSNGGSYVGGIVGSNGKGARVSEAYNSANVSTKAGGRYTGGIVGSNSGTIVNAYNTGAVEGGTYVGGIAGSNSSNSSNSSNIIIQNTYNTGTVSGTSNFGGIVGYNSGTAPISSFFTQGNDNDLGKQISDSELKEFATFAGSSLAASARWDMSKTGGAGKVWRIYEGQTAPLLTAFLKTKDVVTATEYNGEEKAFDNTLAQGIANHIYATDSGNLVKGTNAGKYFGNNTDNNNSGYKVYYSDQGGYDIGDTILVIQPKKLSIADVSKVYDGNQNVISEISINGKVGNDEVNLDSNKVTGVYEDKNAGTDKTVTYTVNTGALTGTDANNYSIASIVTGSGTITAKELSLVHASKVYDGTTDVEASDIVLATDIIENDNVVFDSSKVTGVYEDKNVNDSGSKAITYTVSTGALTGTDAGNYSIGTAGTGDITKANVTLTVEDVVKTYDGTTEVTGGTLKVHSGTLFAGDSISGGTFAFTDKNAGTGNKTVTVSDATVTDGNSGGNYNVTYADNTTSTINKADLTLTAEDVVKTYDGTTAVTGGTLKVLSGTLFTGDSIGGGTFAFTDKNAGTGNKIVTVTDATISDGNGGGNYNVTYANNTTSTINKKALTAIFADISKTYDGTTNTTPGAGTLTGVVAVDAGKVSVSASAAYDEKNAGNRTVNYTGVTLSGEEAGNYSIATTATGNGTISRKALELVADHVSTQYGDYIPATFTGSVTGFVAGEGIGSGDTLLFALSDPSASAVGSYGVTGTINGSASGNYGLNYTFSNAASNANAFVITARPASVQDMVLSDIIPGIKGMTGANISVTALDNSLEQATDKKAEVGIEFAVAQTILSVDAEKNLSLENQGMKQPPAMTPQEVAEQVHAQQGNGNGVAAQASGNAGAASAGANENGAASNTGVAGAVNSAMDVVQQTDDAVGTEESKRKKGVA